MHRNESEAGESKDGDMARPAGGRFDLDRGITAAFLLFLSALGIAACIILFQDGNGKALWIAALSCAALLAVEHLEKRYAAGLMLARNPLPGWRAPLAVISLVALVVCLPTLKVYFIWDDYPTFASLRTLSWDLFLQLFHTDMMNLGWGNDVPLQELRPLHGLFYMLSYQAWGLDPTGYHVTIALVHALNSFLVFLIAKSLAPGDSWRPVFAGVLFAVLPVHAVILSWIGAFLDDGPTTFLYLAAFLCFVRFRATRRAGYLVMSAVAFAGSLLCKEIAVTLPVTLVAYDLFRKVAGERGLPAGANQTGSRPWRDLLLPYTPFAVLFVSYLQLRRLAFSSYLKEDSWGERVQEGLSSVPGFQEQLAYLGTKLWSMQSFNLRQLLLPFPVLVLGIVLGLYLAWALSVLWHRAEHRRTIAVILYFGLVWYAIANAPLLVTENAARRLYLPAVGPCIALAFLALPESQRDRKQAAWVRLLGAGVVVLFSASLLWKENVQWKHWGEMPPGWMAPLAASLQHTPEQTLVVLWQPKDFVAAYGWLWNLPYPLQEPFSPGDLYSRVRIVEFPGVYCCPLSRWWEKTRLALAAASAGDPDERIEIRLLVWDPHSRSFRQESRVLPRAFLRAYVSRELGAPVEDVKTIQKDSADRLVEALARLVSEPNEGGI